MDNKRTDGSQSGRSMVEMLGVLAIIGVLSIGGIAGYSRAMINLRSAKAWIRFQCWSPPFKPSIPVSATIPD